MNVTIIGWYGTETIGDRAILAGILYIISKKFGNVSFFLGSFYPFFTERTLKEDNKLYTLLIENEIDISLFDVRSKQELIPIIQDSDLVLMGGGPLMHINALYLIDYIFLSAKKYKKKTMLFGVGVGPLFIRKYKRVCLNIIKNSDFVVLRDLQSKVNLSRLAKEFNYKLDLKNIEISYDPSVVACIEYISKVKKMPNQHRYIAINLRQFNLLYGTEDIGTQIDKYLLGLIRELIRRERDLDIKFIPMHYFAIGGDDRIYLNKLKFLLGESRVTVQNQNLNLKQTLEVFRNAKYTIGMRFHSVVFQTLINGNNYILDYTEPKIGKITGFLKDVDNNGFYKNRYISLQSFKEYQDLEKLLNFSDKTFEYDVKLINKKLQIYSKMLSKL